MSSSIDYRSDINGLRAWAVVAVILYHFRVPGFNGGFIGVDVFFVISGFLMTGIVVAALEADRFSLLAFYWARARRIVPALAALCAVLLALGWFFLAPGDYRMLGQHAAASLLFLSNLKFWSEAGYFDAASHEKLLLHTWSLSVEWQFYLLLPILLLGAWKWRRGRAVPVVLVALMFALSLAGALLLTPRAPSLAFYLLPTRAWEMLAGALVFFGAVKLAATGPQRRLAEAAGLLLIAGSILAFDASSAWPGWRATLPVLGAALVLLAARSGSAWTGNRLAQWLGTRSYSLYLWHWPVVVTLVLLESERRAPAIAAGLLLTLLLGELSYRWCETPPREWLQRRPMGRASVLLGAATVLVALPGALIWKWNGVPGRLAAPIELAAAEAKNMNPHQQTCFAKKGSSSPSCLHGGTPVRAILLGDSHADAVSTALAAALPAGKGGMLEWTYVSCPTLFGVRNLSPKAGPDQRCGAFLEWVQTQLDAIPAEVPLVIVNRTTSYALGHNEAWERDANVPGVYFSRPYLRAEPAFLAEFGERITASACALARTRPVYLVRPIPEMGVDVPKALSRAAIFGRTREVSIALADYHARHRMVWAAQDAARARCGVHILDPLPLLCRDGRCGGARDGRPLYYDDDHLSEFGNKLLVPMFRTVFARSPAGQAAPGATAQLPAYQEKLQ